MINSNFKTIDDYYERCFGNYDSKPDENKSQLINNITKDMEDILKTDYIKLKNIAPIGPDGNFIDGPFDEVYVKKDWHYEQGSKYFKLNKALEISKKEKFVIPSAALFFNIIDVLLKNNDEDSKFILEQYKVKDEVNQQILNTSIGWNIRPVPNTEVKTIIHDSVYHNASKGYIYNKVDIPFKIKDIKNNELIFLKELTGLKDPIITFKRLERYYGSKLGIVMPDENDKETYFKPQFGVDCTDDDGFLVLNNCCTENTPGLIRPIIIRQGNKNDN